MLSIEHLGCAGCMLPDSCIESFSHGLMAGRSWAASIIMSIAWIYSVVTTAQLACTESAQTAVDGAQKKIKQKK